MVALDVGVGLSF